MCTAGKQYGFQDVIVQIFGHSMVTAFVLLPSWHRQSSSIRTHRHWKIEEPGEQKKQYLFSSKFYSSYRFPTKDSPNQANMENMYKYRQISPSSTCFWIILIGVVAPPWESLTRSLCVQLQHPDWMNLYVAPRCTEHQKIHTLMMLLKLSRSNSHKIPFSLQITVASRMGKFKEFCSPPVRNAKRWSWSRKWSPGKR